MHDEIFARALDNAVVHLSGTETITGIKTFSQSPKTIAPAAGDSSTKIPTTEWVMKQIANGPTIDVSGKLNKSDSNTIYYPASNPQHFLTTANETDPTIPAWVKSIANGTAVNQYLGFNGSAWIARQIQFTDIASVMSFPYVANRFLNGYGAFTPLNTDSVPEGPTNKYFTNARVATYGDAHYYPLSSNPANYLTGTPSALTKTDDTNVTLTLGGTPSTSLLQATSLTLGWTGTLADGRITSASNWNTAYSWGNHAGLYKGIADSSNTVSGFTSLWQNSLKQNQLSGTGYAKWSGSTPSYLTPTQVTADLNLFSSTLKGLAPLSGGGTSNFLRADGTWAAPGGGTYTGIYSITDSANKLKLKNDLPIIPIRNVYGTLSDNIPQWLKNSVIDMTGFSDGDLPKFRALDSTFIKFTPNYLTGTPSALTKTDDTNVTLTLGGTPSTSLLQATSLTLGWTGTLADGRITSASNWNTAYSWGNHAGLYKGIADSSNAVSGFTSLWQNSLKQNQLSGTGYAKWSGSTPSYLTPTQVTADLNLFSSTLKGLAPLSGGGTSNFLRADGTWAAPGGSIPTLSQVLNVGNSSNTNPIELQAPSYLRLSNGSGDGVRFTGNGQNNIQVSDDADAHSAILDFSVVSSTKTIKFPNENDTLATRGFARSLAGGGGSAPTIPATQIAFGNGVASYTSSPGFIYDTTAKVFEVDFDGQMRMEIVDSSVTYNATTDFRIQNYSGNPVADFVSDANNFVIYLGDVNSTANQTLLLIDDQNKKLQYTGGTGKYLNLDLASHRYDIGDIDSSLNNTNILINDSLKTIKLNAVNGVTVSNNIQSNSTTNTFQTLTDGSTITMNVNNGITAQVTIAATGRTFALSNLPSGKAMFITTKIIEGSGGSFTITTWPTGVKWKGGTAPTLSAAAGSVDIIAYFWDGTNLYGTFGNDYK